MKTKIDSETLAFLNNEAARKKQDDAHRCKMFQDRHRWDDLAMSIYYHAKNVGRTMV